MDSPGLSLVKSDILLKDIVEKLQYCFLCVCKFCGFHFYYDMPTLYLKILQGVWKESLQL